jgi:hypothetical protein
MFPSLPTRLSTLLGAGVFARRVRTARPKARWRISWPKIKMQTVSQTCHGIRVTDIALSFSGWDRRQPGAGTAQPKFEGTVYLVWKRKD